MDTQTGKKGQTRRSGTKKLLLKGLPFLAAGFLIAAGMNGIHPSVARDITAGPHVTTTAPASMPGSFAELADKLSPTVVNVKVVKVEQAGLRGPMMPGDPFGEFFGRFY
ncbi:MAG: hypothetical protein IH612_16000, partial [Desulfofustis sp.]|nr:hypothetical protein [Desulfofustis sp.]